MQIRFRSLDTNIGERHVDTTAIVERPVNYEGEKKWGVVLVGEKGAKVALDEAVRKHPELEKEKPGD
jgi:hypothetical protein